MINTNFHSNNLICKKVCFSRVNVNRVVELGTGLWISPQHLLIQSVTLLIQSKQSRWSFKITRQIKYIQCVNYELNLGRAWINVSSDAISAFRKEHLRPCESFITRSYRAVQETVNRPNEVVLDSSRTFINISEDHLLIHRIDNLEYILCLRMKIPGYSNSIDIKLITIIDIETFLLYSDNINCWRLIPSLCLWVRRLISPFSNYYIQMGFFLVICT